MKGKLKIFGLIMLYVTIALVLGYVWYVFKII